MRNRRWGVAPSVAFGLGEPTTVTLDYLHLQEDDTPDFGVPFINGAPASVPRGADYGLDLRPREILGRRRAPCVSRTKSRRP